MTNTDPNADGFDLRPGEVVLHEFRPSLRLFVQRSLLLGIFTTLLFGFVPGLDLTFAERVGVALLLVLVWTIVFDDWRDWISHRNDLWVLTNHRLLFSNPDDIDEAWLNLSDIKAVRPWFWWSIRVLADDGQVTVMSYVGPVGRAVNDLRTAIGKVRSDV